MNCLRLVSCCLLLVVAAPCCRCADDSSVVRRDDYIGKWDVRMACPGGDIAFGLEVSLVANQVSHRLNDGPVAVQQPSGVQDKHRKGKDEKGKDGKGNEGQADSDWQAFLLNGSERIAVPDVRLTVDGLRLDIRHYDSVLTLKHHKGQLTGQWKKRRGANQWVQLQATAVPHRAKPTENADAFTGRWSVQFAESEDPAVGIFRQVGQRVDGTFLTTTGDYRFLSGRVQQGQLQLSCFDGGHAFLFHARAAADGTLTGDFWSASTWHETWTARRDEGAQLPDSFRQTIAQPAVDLDQLKFPDLHGVERSLNDPQFAGKARIIYVFGSWCPNCHDAAAWFAELERRFGDQGLSILGLAFELTGDVERDREQVQRYVTRHGAKYPILIAGLSDKADASRRLPMLDRVRSYPTTIFLDRDNRIRAIHTGFSGPATGEAYDRLRERFELLITELLDD